MSATLKKTTSKSVRQTQFISEFIESGGCKSAAGRAVGVATRTYQRWFKQDPDFQNKIAVKFPEIERALFEEAIRRAMSGSDDLLKFVLRAVNPERYDEGVRRHAFANKDSHGATLIVNSLTRHNVLQKLKALAEQEIPIGIDFLGQNLEE